MNKATILVVDDERGIRQSFNMALKDKYHVLLAGTGEKAIDIFQKNTIDLILLDILLPDIDGIDLLKKLKQTDPNTEIIMVTAVNDLQTAVRAIKLGAYEYIIKPFIVDDVLTVIGRALEKRRLVRQVVYLKNELERYQPFEKMIGKDKKMRDIFELISTVAQSDGTVLIEAPRRKQRGIFDCKEFCQFFDSLANPAASSGECARCSVQGESGTGKELVARAIHNLSPRKSQPFVVINCAAIPSTLMESEIFGYNKGAFTGAVSANMGKLEIADKGTVFFDDIDSLNINMQAKLLRIIQEKEFQRLGDIRLIKADVRFVAASNKNISDLISRGKFREDLFYRLNVFPIKLPPLREKIEDIPLLLNHFFKLYAKKSGRPQKTVSENALKVLMEYDWPGNVREIQNLVERLCTINQNSVILFKDVATLDELVKSPKTPFSVIPAK
ncbi:MAG: sigma-54 dependent transcriptional regulator, partial [Desulfobacterales bacterium]|nr:sigma-54 dependent transcriptional regulator [Desulfobacterales bacterium]